MPSHGSHRGALEGYFSGSTKDNTEDIYDFFGSSQFYRLVAYVFQKISTPFPSVIQNITGFQQEVLY